MPVNESRPSLTEAEATNHQLFTHSSGTKPRNRGFNGTVLHDYLFRVPTRALVGLRLRRGVPCGLDLVANSVPESNSIYLVHASVLLSFPG
jgi:hypothetical protein